MFLGTLLITSKSSKFVFDLEANLVNTCTNIFLIMKSIINTRITKAIPNASILSNLDAVSVRPADTK